MINKNAPSIVRGNKAILRLKLSTDGEPVQNLAYALGARFVAIKRRTDTIAVDKQLVDMVVDDPETGTISIPLTSQETDIAEGTYDIAVQVQWGADDLLEWNFVEALNIVKGIIP